MEDCQVTKANRSEQVSYPGHAGKGEEDYSHEKARASLDDIGRDLQLMQAAVAEKTGSSLLYHIGNFNLY